MRTQEENDYYERVLREEGSWTDFVDFSLGEPEVRIDPTGNTWGNEICCWPSIGGLIVAEGVHPVELEYIGVDRFHVTDNSRNMTKENEFCMKLKKLVGSSGIIILTISSRRRIK